jgi:uncharacterized protein YecE (DUF72 family)
MGMGDIRVGISGWRYGGWRGDFYPKGLPQKRELEFASRKFRTIEINGTFYSLQKASYFRQWRDQAPEDFVFAVKGARFITHMKKLRDCEGPLANFFASGVLELGRKLGPVLWQFPPNFAFDPGRIDRFFAQVPRTLRQAAEMASGHDHRVKDPCTEAAVDGTIRHAIEVRHKSFETPEFVDLLRRRNVALVVADTVDWPYLEDVTADFVYCRLHGSEELYASGYEDAALDDWARRVTAWAAGGEYEHRHCASSKRPRRRAARDVYVYFDNDAKVRAPYDAMVLEEKVKKSSRQDAKARRRRA